MDYQILVQKLLMHGDHCVCCIHGTLVEEGHKQDRVVALVEGQGEYGLFLCLYGPNPEDLKLDVALPITEDFKFNIGGSVPVRIHTCNDQFLLELPKAEEAGIFLSELKRAVSVQTQNSSFGLPSTFAWLEKYLRDATSDASNPFLQDFDPLKPDHSGKEVFGIKLGDGRLVRRMRDMYWRWNMLKSKGMDTVYDNVDSGMSQSSSLQSFNEVDSSQNSLSSRVRPADLNRPYGKSLDNLEEAVRDGKPVGGREHIIKLVMKQKEDEYTETKQFRVFCGSWNVNGQGASEPCNAWLNVDEEPPDIYCVGFQELDLSKNAYIFSDSVREDEWYRTVKQSLHPDATYKMVKLVRLVGIMMIVFIKEEHVSHLYDVIGETVATGVMGVLGNKGGVGIRFDLYDTSICFVNSHLAAHVEEFQRRNQDFRNISARLIFGSRTPEQTQRSISDHDIVFWIGDLNYRLSDIEISEAKSLIETKAFDKLMMFDQFFSDIPNLTLAVLSPEYSETSKSISYLLVPCRHSSPGHQQLTQQITAKKVFLDYVEGRITFRPTYRYDVGTDNWDSSEKQRVPAWTDRILWRGTHVRQIVYRSHPALKLSDHKPVSAVFDTGVKIIKRKQYRVVYEEVMKQLDRWENEFLPQVKLHTTDIVFKDVKFIEPQTQTITVTNTGQVPVEYDFINKPGENTYCKPWLNVEPSSAVIKKGGSCDIQIEAYVDKLTASRLNNAQDQLEDILVLHLQGGKDLFITISGNYVVSSFGSSIEALIYMFAPIREVPTEDLIMLEKSSSQPSSPIPDTVARERPLDVPKELWRLINHLYLYGMDREDLFQQPGKHVEIQAIRDCLDTGTPETIPGNVHSVAEALLVFIEALSEPIIPCSFYAKCLDCCSNFTLCKQVLSQVSVSHRTVFTYLCAFLRKLLQHSHTNNLDVKILAPLFGSLVLRRLPSGSVYDHPSTRGPSKSQMQIDERKKAAFMYHFLTNEYDE